MKRLLPGVVCVVLSLLFAAHLVWGQSGGGLLEMRTSRTFEITLRVVVDRQGGALVMLDREGGDALIAASSAAAVDRALAQSIGGSLRPLGGWTGRQMSRSWSVTRRSNDWLRRKGLWAQGAINPDPLRPLMRVAHIPYLIVEVSPRNAPRFTSSDRYPQRMRSGNVYYRQTYFEFPQPGPELARLWKVHPRKQPSLTVRMGYTPADLIGVAAPLMLVLLLPVVVTLWMRVRALRVIAAGEVDSATVLFGFNRFLQQMIVVVWLLWLPLDYGLGLRSVLEFFWDGALRFLPLPFLAYYLPALTSVACTLLAQPVFQRVWDKQLGGENIVKDSLIALAMILPLVFYSVAASYLLESPVIAAAWATVGYAASRGVGLLGKRTVLRVTGGELFDKAQRLSSASGLPPASVIVLPGAAGSFANAFATKGNRVLLTKYLLDSLSKREVDAIMAHQMTHQKYKHPMILGATYLASAGLSIGAAFWAALHHVPAAWLGVIQSATLLLSLFGQTMIGRAFERVADAGALALTGDPVACMTGLGKITRLNRMPMEWGKWDKYWLTHPSTAQRFREIAKRGGLTEDQVKAAMEAAGTETADDRYTIAVRPAAAAPAV
ncbi:MAG: peptidase Ste24p [Capsulimonas sp.]|nr:peptidase Ste24p [Capsulimonas sp.]